MEDFRKKLDALLTEYPDLPEFTLTVRPRIIIEIKNPKLSSELPPGIVLGGKPPVITQERIKELSQQTTLGL